MWATNHIPFHFVGGTRQFSTYEVEGENRKSFKFLGGLEAGCETLGLSWDLRKNANLLKTFFNPFNRERSIL